MFFLINYAYKLFYCLSNLKIKEYILGWVQKIRDVTSLYVNIIFLLLIFFESCRKAQNIKTYFFLKKAIQLQIWVETLVKWHFKLIIIIILILIPINNTWRSTKGLRVSSLFPARSLTDKPWEHPNKIYSKIW